MAWLNKPVVAFVSTYFKFVFVIQFVFFSLYVDFKNSAKFETCMYDEGKCAWGVCNF